MRSISERIRFALAVFISSCLVTAMAAVLLTDNLSISATKISFALMLGLVALSAAIGYLYSAGLSTLLIAAVFQAGLSILLSQGYEYLRLHGTPSELSVRQALEQILDIGKILFFWSALVFFSGAWLGKGIRAMVSRIQKLDWRIKKWLPLGIQILTFATALAGLIEKLNKSGH